MESFGLLLFFYFVSHELNSAERLESTVQTEVIKMINFAIDPW